MSGFDRIKPPEKRLLEREESRQPDSREADTAGRAALFSVSGEPTAPGAGVPAPLREPRHDETGGGVGHVDGSPTGPDDERLPQGTSPLHVECGHCGVTCPVPLGHALRKALPMMVVAPWRSHPVFATCPCGERRAWLKPSVGLPR